MRKIAGLTILEMMAVVIIIGILAYAAIPTYANYEITTRRGEAQTAVTATESLVQRYLAENNQPTLGSADLTSNELKHYSTTTTSPALSQNGYYRITVVPDSGGYTINATATVSGGLTDCSSSNAAQCADTTCRVISIADGNRQSTNSTGGVASASTTVCW